MAAIEGASRHSGSVGDTTHDLYRRYGKQIYAYCYQRLRSKEEAEDAVQTTFMNAFRSLQRGATAEYEQAWLFKIAQNVCIARHSNASRRLSLEAPNDFEVLQEVVPARDGEEPLELIGIEEALERMPENQRRAILLREWQGLSYREICDELGLSQAAVEMLIFRARRTLAGALEQPGDEKQKRVGRKVGSLGSILGALKTLFGGGAAIKAAAVAAAAIAVVGESASHTIVRHASTPSAVRRVRAASPAVTAAIAQSPSHAVRAGRDAGVALAPKHTRRTHAAAAAPDDGATRTTVTPRRAEPTAAAPVTTTTTASTPPPPSVAVPPAAPTPPPTASPSPMPTPAPAADPGGAKKKEIPVQPTPTPTATTTTTAPTATTPTTSTTTPVATDPQPGSWNDARGHFGKLVDPQPAPVVTVPSVDTQPVVTTPATTTTPVVQSSAPAGKGSGLGLGRANQQP